MIAVIIPALNEAAHIGDLLDQVRSDAPNDLCDVLVADGGSTDGTREIVAAVARIDPRVKLVDNPHRLQSAGINLAAGAADPRATVLIRLDAHAGYPRHYVRDLQAVLAQTGADSVVVRLRTTGDGCFQKAVAAVSNSVLGTGAASHRVGGVSRWIDHGHHAAFRRASFAGVGGYDPSFRANEDAEFDVRLRRAGGRVWFAAELEVDYYPRRTVGGLARQYFSYGNGRARNLRKNGEQLRLRQFAPPVLVSAMVVAFALSPFAPWTLALPLAYFGVAALAGITLAFKGRDLCLLGAAFALPAMHLAWGSGFLLGVSRAASSIAAGPGQVGAADPHV